MTGNEAVASERGFPRIRPHGLGGMLVSFADTLSDPASRAATAFRAQLEVASWEGVRETAATLASVFVRFDPHRLSHDDLRARLHGLLAERDWMSAELPTGRRLWTIPCAYGGALAPQLDEAASLAGMTAERAVEQLSAARVRVLTIGFAPGQPYLGTLPEAWDLPRQGALTASVPVGALIVAVRQLVLFTATAPTGWRHVGQTAFRGFRPDAETPFALRPGDELMFPAISADEYANLKDDPAGGARSETLA